MNINPGEFKKKIDIIEIVNDQDKDGFPIQTNRVVHSCWAKFSRTSGTELVRANADFSEVAARFLIRFTKKEINTKMYVRYAGKLYDILYINNYEDSDEYIEIWGRIREK